MEPNLNKDFDDNDNDGWRYSISFNIMQRLKRPQKLAKGHNSGGFITQEDLEDNNE